jgi:hypothetical protein
MEVKTSRTEYMRKYKKEEYKQNPEKIKAINKVSYYKNKFNLTNEEVKKYNNILPLVAKFKGILNEIQAENGDILQDLLAPYIITTNGTNQLVQVE